MSQSIKTKLYLGLVSFGLSVVTVNVLFGSFRLSSLKIYFSGVVVITFLYFVALSLASHYIGWLWDKITAFIKSYEPAEQTPSVNDPTTYDIAGCEVIMGGSSDENLARGTDRVMDMLTGYRLDESTTDAGNQIVSLPTSSQPPVTAEAAARLGWYA